MRRLGTSYRRGPTYQGVQPGHDMEGIDRPLSASASHPMGCQYSAARSDLRLGGRHDGLRCRCKGTPERRWTVVAGRPAAVIVNLRSAPDRSRLPCAFNGSARPVASGGVEDQGAKATNPSGTSGTANTVHGPVHGFLVQAGHIHGGVHHYHGAAPAPVPAVPPDHAGRRESGLGPEVDVGNTAYLVHDHPAGARPTGDGGAVVRSCGRPGACG